ncbi:MAG TPA: hypothetical protein VK589_21735 [Chryseolinea sp.]|nr:hypothetical protein [Chryseolinea sp.]
MKNPILPLALLVIVVACNEEKDVTPIKDVVPSKDVTPTKTTLLTVRVDASFPTETIDDWIVVHSEDGEVLAFESFETNSVVVLETEKTVNGNITTTQIRHSKVSNFDMYSVESHTDIQKGKTIVLDSYSITPLSKTGELNVSISNVNAIDQQALSSRVGSGGSSSWSSDTNILEMNTSTYPGVTKYVVSIDDGSALKYKILDNVKPNDNYSFSFLDMSQFDNTITFNFPTSPHATLFISGSDPDPSLELNRYVLLAHYNFDTHSELRAGYLNSMTNYTTRLAMTYPDYGLEYMNVGSIPNPNIVWPSKSDFSITSSNIDNFKASASKPFIWRLSTWSFLDGQNNLSWNVYGPSDQHVIGELPSEIVSQFPALAFSKLTYNSTVFFTEAMSYEDYINSDFAGEPVTQGTRLGIRILAK